ncbi:acetoacetate decarboxylase [Catenovulum sediminis]|uniref:Acetoacetate decarboxylase n=1 Tax=Catenovulum sediminis TaxID=1740262 RepID=A0ABV1RKP1_9ALTE
MNNNLPEYQHYLSNVVSQPPCKMINANMYGFFVKGEISKIQAYVDSTINKVEMEGVRFKALSPYLMLSFTDIEKMFSTNPAFSNQGWSQETDIIIWIPVAKMVNNKVDHVYFYPAYIVVNNLYALLNGTLIWGFNKYFSNTYEMPAIGEVPEKFSLTVDAFKAFAPDATIAPHTILELALTKKGDSRKVAGFGEILKEAITLLQLSTESVFDFDWNAVKQSLSQLISPQIDQLLFKQYPDGKAENALYQALIHSPSIVDKVHSATIYTHEYQFSIQHLASFPLDQMFGISLQPQKPLLPFNVLFDFSQDAAIEIAKNN